VNIFSREQGASMTAEWFAGRLKELREQAGLTQRTLADKASVHVDAIARWEAGRREPLWGNVLALAAALGVEVGAFAVAPQEQAAPRSRGRPRKQEEASAKETKSKGRKRKGK
jgi:transcriptional regulator with XRE-family HTH domain